MAAQQGKLTAFDIAEKINQSHPEQYLTRDDVQNIIDDKRRAIFEGRTPTQQLLYDLTNDGEAIVEYVTENGGSGKLEFLFWTYRWCIDMWKDNWELMSIDDTYKTNRFNLPLMQITGVTGMNTTFSMGWAVMKGESEECYRWSLSQVGHVAAAHGVSRPLVIISDYDSAFRAASRIIFPEVPTLICLWHVMKNVAFNIKKKWEGSLEGTILGQTVGGNMRKEDHDNVSGIADANDERLAEALANGIVGDEQRLLLAGGIQQRLEHLSLQQHTHPHHMHFYPGREYAATADGILQAWKDCVYAPTEEEFDSKWRQIETEFQDQPAIMHYLADTYLPVREEFATYAAQRHRTYGVRVTSRTEGSHASLKRLLKNRNGDLYTLGSAVKQMCHRQKVAYQQQKSREMSRSLSRCHGNAMYNLLRCNVSFFALNHVIKQVENVRGAMRDPRGGWNWECRGNFTRSYGLPCWHRLYEIVQHNGVIGLYNFDMHWRFVKSPLPADDEALRHILDPAVIPRRYPTSRRHDTSTRRDRSHDELRWRPYGTRGDMGGADRRQDANTLAQLGANNLPHNLPQPRAESRCSVCGQPGHRYNSVRCPRRGT